MEMVAASKMKRAMDRVVAARPYARALGEVMSRLYSPELAERFPLLRQPTQVRRAAVVLITGNRGLSGAFNANLIRESRNLVRHLDAADDRTDSSRDAAAGRGGKATRLSALSVGGRDSLGATAGIRPEHDLSRARRERRSVLQRATDGDEERDRQRERHAQHSSPHVQSRPPGEHHAGDRRDRRRRSGTAGMTRREASSTVHSRNTNGRDNGD